MLLADFTQGFVMLIIFFLLLGEDLNVPFLFFLLVCLSVISTFHSLAFDTSYIMLVPEEYLPRANAMMNTMWTLTGVIAPVLAATLFSVNLFGAGTGMVSAIGVDAVTFFLSGLSILFLKIPSPIREEKGKSKDKTSFRSDMKLGFRYLFKHPPFLLLIVLGFIETIVYSVDLLLPVITKETLFNDWSGKGWSYPFAYSFLDTMGFIGATLAGILMSWWGGLKKNRIYGVLVPLLVSGVMIMLFGFSTSIYLSAAFLFMRMFTSSIVGSHQATIWQSNVPAVIQGRVFGVRKFVSSIAPPLGTTLIGLWGAKINSGVVFIVLGAVLAFVAFISLFNKRLLSIDK
nr:MFS transporter [Paenactinomyces guangxiensis]